MTETLIGALALLLLAVALAAMTMADVAAWPVVAVLLAAGVARLAEEDSL